MDKLDEEELAEAALASDQDEDEMDEGEDDEGDEESMSEDESEEDDEVDEGEGKKPGGGAKATTGLKKSAAGLCVHMGSFSDPCDVPGLAHFLEHMVFMGSDKYPDENSFDKFISLGGGFDNAHTDCETTVFYFDVQRKKFREGENVMF